MKKNKRVHYDYTDWKKGNLSGWVDIDMEEDEEWMPEHEIQAIVKRKWKNTKYIGGDLYSVHVTSVQD